MRALTASVVAMTISGITQSSSAQAVPSYGPASAVLPAAQPTAAFLQRNIHSFDMDNDGDRDILVFAASLTGNVPFPFLAVNDSTATSLATNFQTTVAIPPITSSMNQARVGVPALLDGDQLPDILMGTQGGEVFWYRNLGGLTFQGPPLIVGLTSTPGLEQVTAVDVDNDGDLDVIAKNSLFFNRLDEFTADFSPRIPFFAGVELCVGDLDGDGDDDLVSASGAVSLNASFFDSNGNFIFGSTTSLSGPPPGDACRLGDLDGDGDLDIVGTNLDWWENDGAGTFGPAIPFETPDPLGNNTPPLDALELGDIDSDGDVDVVGLGAGIIVFENTDGFATPTLPTTFPGGNGQFLSTFGLGDLDGDLRPDVAAVKVSAASPTNPADVFLVDVFENTTPVTPWADLGGSFVGTPGVTTLTGRIVTPVAPTQVVTELYLRDGLPGAPTALIVSYAPTGTQPPPLMLPSGTLHATGTFLFAVPPANTIGVDGTLTTVFPSYTLPAALPATNVTAQFLVDNAPVGGVGRYLSNAVRVTLSNP